MQRGIFGNGFRILPIEPSHTAALTTLPFHHRDSFDRLLVAQASVEQIPILSADAAFDAYGVVRRWWADRESPRVGRPSTAEPHWPAAIPQKIPVAPRSGRPGGPRPSFTPLLAYGKTLPAGEEAHPNRAHTSFYSSTPISGRLQKPSPVPMMKVWLGLPRGSISDAASAPLLGTLERRMDGRTLRKFELALVLGVAFRSAWIGSAYAGLASHMRLSTAFRNVEIIQALTTQTVALAVLAYVLFRQGRTFGQIGFSPRWRDIPASLLLTACAYAVLYGVYLTYYYGCYFLTGRPVARHAASTLLTSGAWTWGLLLVALLNPFFEELIVRAYTMSELKALGAGTFIPIVASVALQTSYHLYQGSLNAAALAGYFLVLAIYFHRSGRIFPVILAHLYSDVLALLRSAHH